MHVHTAVIYLHQNIATKLARFIHTLFLPRVQYEISVGTSNTKLSMMSIKKKTVRSWERKERHENCVMYRLPHARKTSPEHARLEIKVK